MAAWKHVKSAFPPEPVPPNTTRCLGRQVRARGETTAYASPCLEVRLIAPRPSTLASGQAMEIAVDFRNRHATTFSVSRDVSFLVAVVLTLDERGTQMQKVLPSSALVDLLAKRARKKRSTALCRRSGGRVESLQRQRLHWTGMQRHGLRRLGLRQNGCCHWQ